MSEWKKLEIGDLIESVSDTYKFSNDEVVFLNTSDILEGKVLNHTKCSPCTLPGQAKKSIQKGDILYSEIRPANKRFACIGFSAENYVVSTKLMVLRPKEKSLTKYIYLYLTSNKILNYLQFLAEGRSGTFPQITFSEVSELIINIPPVKTLHYISSTLSNLDSKIDFLRRQNQTLENIAQTLFKRWFIDFEFPDKKGKPYKSSGGKMVESELGEIPEGWRAGKLSEEFNITMGQSPPGTSYNEICEGTVFFQGRTDFGCRFPTERLYTTEPKRMANKFDTLLSVRAPVGDINMAFSDCCIGRGLAAISGNNGSYTYYKSKSLKSYFDIFESEGTVFGSINQMGLKNIDAVIPLKDISKHYESISSKLDSKIYVNSKEVQILIKTRDTLLPKLMSGQIRVK